ncbi:hypothetical protein FQN57_007429 [Myotisia sp. PD_48]|nr:hypothetical protein FQN57_007429 [Myotisia sp. PD_48]
MADDQKDGLFKLCSICIVCSPQIDADLAEKLSKVIREYDGEAVIYQASSSSPTTLTEFTHIISSTIDFQGHDSVCDALIPVVKPQWVHNSIGKKKLANPRQYNPDPRLFLNEVVVSCVDIPDGDKDAIIGGVLAMGGLYTARITSSTTHLVALTMDSDKCKAAKKRELNIKIVLPHWFDDCLKLGKRIDERPYMLPDPEILRPTHDVVPMRIPMNKDVIGASTPTPSTVPDVITSPSKGRQGLNVFNGKTVMISSDLNIAERLTRSIEQLIESAGGRVTHNVSDVDIFVCRYRAGDDYKSASRAGKDVGNIAWLYYLVTHNTWTSPLRKLLHYPIAQHGIPGFHKFRISLSNYAGEARIYLENLIAATGAECTKTLKQDNTHLITAHGNSEKCTAAREWNLHVVNHLWLEESYAKWQEQTVTEPRYTHFPQRTNLTEVVGQTPIDKFAVEENFYFSPEMKFTDQMAARTDAQQKDKNIVPVISVATPISNPKLKKKALAEVAESAGHSKTQANVKGRKSAKDKHLQTPVVAKSIRGGKENETPSTTGSRKSKDIAAARLHELVPDMALYEKEKKRVGGVLYGGRRRSDNEDIIRKRSVEPDESSEAEEGGEVKKLKMSKPPVTMHILISSYSRWAGDERLEDIERRRLRDLGILIVTDASKCTHLAAPRILRTQKFFNALVYAPIILHCDFVTHTIEKDEVQDPNDYILRDTASETRFNFTLEGARLRAKKNEGKLFQGRTFYCLESVGGGFDIYKSIVETNGGQCILYRGRPGTVISRRSATGNPDIDQADEYYLISGPDKSNGKLWAKFRTLVLNAKKNPIIISTEWLLEMAMVQEWRPYNSFVLDGENVHVDESS